MNMVEDTIPNWCNASTPPLVKFEKIQIEKKNSQRKAKGALTKLHISNISLDDMIERKGKKMHQSNQKRWKDRKTPDENLR